MKSAFHHLTHKLKNRLGIAPPPPLPGLRKLGSGAEFADVQRRIRIYLRALWDIDFIINPTEGEFDHRHGRQPFIAKFAIHLPNSYFDFALDGFNHLTALQSYRAAASHAAAHLVYSRPPFAAESLDKWQQAVISTIEDARVETLAIRRFPGLKRLWAMQHTSTPLNNHTAGDYLRRLARALLDESYMDVDPWIVQGRALFAAVADMEADAISREIGLTLAASFEQKKIKFKIRTDMLSAPYRCDNRYIWETPNLTPGTKQESSTTFYEGKYCLGIGEADTVDEDSEDPTSATPDETCDTETAAGTFHYPEWNFRSQIETQSWVTLREKNLESGDLKIIDDITAQNIHLISRMKTLLQAIRCGGVQRIRKLEEGDEIDINAAIRAQIEIKMGGQPDPRIMMRSMRKNRDISVLLLIDLSNSTNEIIDGQEHTVLQLTQQVCVLFADAIKTLGDPFAIHGFCSEGRHNVEYFRLKDFNQPYDDVPKAKIAGMTGQRATRMGAAIRHATYHLGRQSSAKKVLMLVTDGAPSDIDVRGHDYLIHDTKKAVEAAGRNGINTYCFTLDPGADEYVSRIFGARNYMVVDHIRRLPEKMLLLYTALTR
jgi:nitric oxide reductase NorD protein